MHLGTTVVVIMHGVVTNKILQPINTQLPYGKDLFGDSLKKALTDILDEYSTDIVVNKLAPCTNSQRNESLNSTIGSKNRKSRFYGGSESNNFRVACGVAQTNLGYDYIGKTLKALDIEPGYYHNTHASAMDRKVICDKQRKRTKAFKRRRNQLSQQKTFTNIEKGSQRRNHIRIIGGFKSGYIQ